MVLMHADVCPAPVPHRYSHVPAGNIVAAYFGSWDKYGEYKVSDIEPIASTLTHIIYAFAKPDVVTASCQLHDPWADVGANFEHRKKVGGHFGQLLKLKQKYSHLKFLLSVGGGTYSKYFSDLTKPEVIQSFAQSCVGLLDRYEYAYEHSKRGSDHVHVFNYQGLFDGIDLDWEWQGATVADSEVKNFHALVFALVQELEHRILPNDQKSLLSCAIQAHPKIIESLQLHKIVSSVDWFNVMAYDFGGENAPGVSMNAPICNPWSHYSIDASISLLMNLHIAPNKIVLGIPLYGHVYDQTQEKLGSSFEKTEKTGAMTYAQIKGLYLDNPDCKKKWHKKSQVPYAYCSDESIFVSYDNEQSVRAKFEYAKNKRLQGIVFWRLSGDDKNHNLVKSIR